MEACDRAAAAHLLTYFATNSHISITTVSDVIETKASVEKKKKNGVIKKIQGSKKKSLNSKKGRGKTKDKKPTPSDQRKINVKEISAVASKTEMKIEGQGNALHSESNSRSALCTSWNTRNNLVERRLPRNVVEPLQHRFDNGVGTFNEWRCEYIGTCPNNSMRASLASSRVNMNFFDRPRFALGSFHHKPLPSLSMGTSAIGESQDIFAGFMAKRCKPIGNTLLREILERSRSHLDRLVNSQNIGGMQAIPQFREFPGALLLPQHPTVDRWHATEPALDKTLPEPVEINACKLHSFSQSASTGAQKNITSITTLQPQSEPSNIQVSPDLALHQVYGPKWLFEDLMLMPLRMMTLQQVQRDLYGNSSSGQKWK